MTREAEIYRRLLREQLLAYVVRAFYELNPGAEFIYGHYIRAICHQLERVANGEVKRLIIALPPRHLKSFCASVAFPAWTLGRDPAARIVCASHGADLAQTFSLLARKLIESRFHRWCFPGLVLDARKASLEELRTTWNGYRIATSVGGSLTGKGGDTLIIDDPLKAEDAHSEAKRDANYGWYTGTLASRLDDPNTGAIILVAQRLHPDDLAGRLIATGDWEVLELAAIAPRRQEVPLRAERVWIRQPGSLLHAERIGKEELDRIRRELGSSAFEAQYNQRPTPPGGNLVKTEWFGRYPEVRKRPAFEAIVQSWDTAAVPGEGNDYSVCTTWGVLGEQVHLLDVFRDQLVYPDLVRAARRLREKWNPRLIVIEKATNGISLLQDLRRAGFLEARGLAPGHDKVSRLVAQTAKIEAGRVCLPTEAPWLEGFLGEVAAFPNGKHDDQVDSMSQALRALDKKPRELRGLSCYR